MIPPPCCLTVELIKTKELVTTLVRQNQAMAHSIQQIVNHIQKKSSVALSQPITPEVDNVESAGKLCYSVYEKWHKKQRKSPKQLFIDWFIYELQAGYEEDIIQSASISSTTKSAFK
jgi:hypothetical protein